MLSSKAVRPSNLHRRERCPGSLRMERELPEVEKDPDAPASRGNRIHADISGGFLAPSERMQILAESDDAEICQKCWDHGDGLWATLTRDERERAHVWIEKPVDLSSFAMDAGTPDFAIVVLETASESGKIILRDWKSGMGYVQPSRWNLQLAAYACGLSAGMNTATVDIGIFQPLVRDYADSWVTTLEELKETGERIKSIVAHAEAHPAPLIPGGWCNYCRACDQCPTRLAVAAEVKVLISPIDAMLALEGRARADLYRNIGQGIKMLETAKDAIEEKILDGSLVVEGFGIGAGRKSRVWSNSDQAFAELTVLAIKNGKQQEEVFQPISVAQAEKLFPKTNFETPILTKEGKPTVVRVKQ
jgi:Protein of unknown function (DUF2800)